MGLRTGSTTLVVTLYRRNASATILMVSADASMPVYTLNLCHLIFYSGSTCLDHVNSNVIADSIELLLHECRRRVVDVLYTLCVLRCKSSRSSHCIASMCSNDLLVSFKSTVDMLSVAIDEVIEVENRRTLHLSCPSRRLPRHALKQPLKTKFGLTALI